MQNGTRETNGTWETIRADSGSLLERIELPDGSYLYRNTTELLSHTYNEHGGAEEVRRPAVALVHVRLVPKTNYARGEKDGDQLEGESEL